ncbi:hypothetical protein GOQ27_03515 [Clostridium sp. D2Q-11]|uniref:Uncharacterized protein n=1 Tax=Anaeromonas frigoriresistens TaxID=2683708 RepID=A0A942UVE0_9FIRM|nr:hypothetical protein [Anaeromonas frigoriresistens]MBS4537514.1 hypothetical protein [Anaeromonas frigoriresistens]
MIFRLISFIYFSFSWQWTNPVIKSLNILIGILFLSLWFIYGFKNSLGFKHGFIIGISDAIILLVLTLILYITRGSYYIGPVTMMPWIIPFLGISDTFKYISNMLLCIIPFISIVLTALGSSLGIHYNKESYHT